MLITLLGSFGEQTLIPYGSHQHSGTSDFEAFNPSTDSYPQGFPPNIYEYQVNVAAGITGDVNYDGVVNVQDIVAMVSCILGDGDCTDEMDLTGDGIVNVIDIVSVVTIILNNTRVMSSNDMSEIDRQLQRLINSGVPTKSERQQLEKQLNKLDKRPTKQISTIRQTKPRKQKRKKEDLINNILRLQDK